MEEEVEGGLTGARGSSEHLLNATREGVGARAVHPRLGGRGAREGVGGRWWGSDSPPMP